MVICTSFWPFLGAVEIKRDIFSLLNIPSILPYKLLFLVVSFQILHYLVWDSLIVIYVTIISSFRNSKNAANFRLYITHLDLVWFECENTFLRYQDVGNAADAALKRKRNFITAVEYEIADSFIENFEFQHRWWTTSPRMSVGLSISSSCIGVDIYVRGLWAISTWDDMREIISFSSEKCNERMCQE